MGKNDILRTIDEHKGELASRGVKSLSIFGSYARGEERPESDVDILVEFAVPVGLFEFIRLKRYLERILGVEVDLVTRDALKTGIKERVIREAVHAA
ncbi:MAG: nucleotidyltransferase family protein [Deltaproteobacteria bacterium]|nr:nucleotidyltransferase family protein [Deltaproteobacteria bacterium]